MLRHLRTAIALMIVMTALTGLAYPLAMTAIAQLLFSSQANGSLIYNQAGQIMGSRLIGQPFDDPRYFWGRPSATAEFPYNAALSGGSNLGPMNAALIEGVQARIQALRDADPGNTAPLPVDLVTSSGSGLDPHISPAAAEYQVPRVARLRSIDESRVRLLVQQHTERRDLGFIGEPRVNVLTLNLALDQLQ